MKRIFIVASISLLVFACAENKNTEKELPGSAVIETHPVHGSVVQASFDVMGNCGMCKSTIEEAARLKGVTFCNWDTTSKICTVTYDSTKINVTVIEKAIAAAGYDNMKYMADDKAYAELAPCCQYERKK